MVRVLEDGISVPLEVWHVPVKAVGGLLRFVGTPLGIGQVSLRWLVDLRGCTVS